MTLAELADATPRLIAKSQFPLAFILEGDGLLIEGGHKDHVAAYKVTWKEMIHQNARCIELGIDAIERALKKL